MTKFDDSSWHAIATGPPSSQSGLLHIGIYLAWLIERKLLRAGVVQSRDLAALHRRSIDLTELADHMDGKLLSDRMTRVGEAFTGAAYRGFLAIWDSVPPSYLEKADRSSGWELYDRISPALDALYRTWESGRTDMMVPRSRRLDSGAAQAHMVTLGTRALMPVPAPHVDTDLERRLLKFGSDSEVASMRGVKDVSLRSAIKNLGGRVAEATTADTIIGHGPSAVMISAVRVPGIHRRALQDAVRNAAFVEGGAQWTRRVVRTIEVDCALGRKFSIAVWTDKDGVAFHAGGDRAAVETILNQVGFASES